MHAPDEATEDVWRLLARRIIDVARAEMREEFEARLDAEAARAALDDVEVKRRTDR